MINKSTEENIHSLNWWANIITQNAHGEENEKTAKILGRRAQARNGYEARLYLEILAMNTLFYAYNHIFDINIFFSIFTSFFRFILHLLLQRVWRMYIQCTEHTDTDADTDTHKQTECESTFHIADRWRVCTRINIRFVRSFAGMQTYIHAHNRTHTHILCIKSVMEL